MGNTERVSRTEVRAIGHRQTLHRIQERSVRAVRATFFNSFTLLFIATVTLIFSLHCASTVFHAMMIFLANVL